MGQLFSLIADAALLPLDAADYAECHVCGRADAPLYPYQGTLHRPNGPPDDDIYAACHACLLTQPLTHTADFEYIRIIDRYLTAQPLPATEQAAARAALVAAYQRTPDQPLFMQHEDRPLCCHAITEYTGFPADAAALLSLAATRTYWEKEARGPADHPDFRCSGPPESWSDVALFCCCRCERAYYTFQFT